MKTLSKLVLAQIILFVLFSACRENVKQADDRAYQNLKAGFKTPPLEARPKGMWCWINGNFDKEGITEEIREVAEKGMGGLDIWDSPPVTDFNNVVPTGPGYPSDEFMEGVKYANDEALKYGINLGFIWNQSVSYRDPENEVKVLETTEKLIEILKPQGEILAEALNVEFAPFDCLRLKIPSEWTMNGQHCKCGETIATAYPDEEDMLYRNPFYHKLSPQVWHKDLLPRYHEIRKGSESVIKTKEESMQKMIALSDSLLSKYKKLENKLDDKTYAYYLFKLEENNWHLKVMNEWMLAWLKASNILYFDNNDKQMKEEVANHLESLKELNLQTKKELNINWYGKQINIKRGEYLDIPGYIEMFQKYWGAVIN